ncbi:MAG: hypothetical protein V3V82_00625 [Acidimicrobiia bacterium]
MPIWSTDVPKPGRGPSFPLKRTPQGRGIIAIVTSDDLVGCDTHWWGGHTVPCEGEQCEAHKAGIPFRWHGYLSAVDTTSHLHFIFEMTAQAADTFKDFRKAHGSLRGCIFEAKRLKSAHNSRVCIRCKPADLREAHLPQPPDLPACMAIIWSVPHPDVAIAGTLKDVPHIRLDRQAVTDHLPPGNGRQPVA